MDENKRKKFIRTIIVCLGAFVFMVLSIALISMSSEKYKGERNEVKEAETIEEIRKDGLVDVATGDTFYAFANYYLFGEDSDKLFEAKLGYAGTSFYEKMDRSQAEHMRELGAKLKEAYENNENMHTYALDDRASYMRQVSMRQEEVSRMILDVPNLDKDYVYSYYTAKGEPGTREMLAEKQRAFYEDDTEAVQTYSRKLLSRDEELLNFLQIAQNSGCLSVDGAWSEGQQNKSIEPVISCMKDRGMGINILNLYSVQDDEAQRYLAGRKTALASMVIAANGVMRTRYEK